MASRGTAGQPIEQALAGVGLPPASAGLSRAEFAAMFVESWAVLRTIAASVMGGPAQADDVLQEAAVIALQKLDSFRPGTCFEAWMGQIVRFVALNAARRGRRRHAEASFDVADQQDSRTRLDGSFDDRVTAALRRLDGTARECLLLRVVHEAPYRRISLLLDIPEGTAMSHVHRARQTLRELLGPADHGDRQRKDAR